MSPVVPPFLRSAVPERLRNHPRLRAAAISAGLIAPRVLHSPAEGTRLAQLARGAHRVVELGVYEAASAAVFVRVLGAGAELHLVDPFIDASGWALPEHWGATPHAAHAVVRRALAARPSDARPDVRWHVRTSQSLGAEWDGGPVDLVFIDGDHSPEGCREDWERWSPYVRPGGAVAFHDARLGQPGGDGSPGPTEVVDALRADPAARPGWEIRDEVDTLVVFARIA